MMNLRLLSSGLGAAKIALKRRQICWSTHLKKSFLGGLGIRRKMYPSESSSEPMPL